MLRLSPAKAPSSRYTRNLRVRARGRNRVEETQDAVESDISADGDYAPPSSHHEEDMYDYAVEEQPRQKRPPPPLANPGGDFHISQRGGQPRLPALRPKPTLADSTVVPRGARDSFLFLKNHVCRCNDPTLSKEERVAKCTVLTLFPVVFLPVLESLFCREHNRLLIPDDYPSHLRTSHGEEVKAHRLGLGDLKSLAVHLQSSFSLINDVDQLCQRLPTVLKEPLTTLSPPRHPPIALRYQCPEPGCFIWFAISHGKTNSKQHDLLRHTKDAHSKSLPLYDNRPHPDTPFWTYKVAITGNKFYTFKLPEDYPLQKAEVVGEGFHDTLPSHEVREELLLVRTDPATPQDKRDSKHEDPLGWNAYRKELQAKGLSVDFLKNLVRPLAPVARKPLKLRQNSRGHLSLYLEAALAELKPLLCRYLKNALQFAYSNHPSIRNLIVPR